VEASKIKKRRSWNQNKGWGCPNWERTIEEKPSGGSGKRAPSVRFVGQSNEPKNR